MRNRIESKQDRIAFLCTNTVIELLERTKRHCGLAKPRSRDYGKSARPKPSPTSLSTFMSTLDRYVAGDISKPLLIFCPALLFLYANFTAIRYLDRVASGLLPADAVLPLLLVNSAIALVILLPIGFHISVVVGLSRLYTDSEMTAFFACGDLVCREESLQIPDAASLYRVGGAFKFVDVRPDADDQNSLLNRTIYV